MTAFTKRPVRAPTGYGLAADAPDADDWSAVEAKLTAARNYWICTTSPSGRPHAAPAWGLWHAGRLVFSTDPQSRKGRNLAASPEIVVHLESGDDAVIVSGVASELDEASRADVVAAYAVKYAMPPETFDNAGTWLAVTPRRVLTWRERDYPTSATAWEPRDQALAG